MPRGWRASLALAGGIAVAAAANSTLSTAGAAKVLREHREALMALPGVVGSAIGSCDGNPCIQVYIAQRSPELEDRIPKSLQGYPVKVIESGRFQALPRR